MSGIIEAFLLVSISIAVFDLYFVVRNSATLTRNNQPQVNLKSVRRLVMIMAVYEETETIEQAIQFLNSDATSGVDEVIIVGNAKERNLDGVNPTLQLAMFAAQGIGKIRILECDQPGAIKAHQVNFAASQVQGNSKETWIYVMDVDTRFTSQNVQLLRSAIDQGHEIIQQHTHFLESFSDNSLLGKSFAAHQTRWTLAHEMTRIFLFNKFRIGVYHLVGHGMCIQVRLFLELGGFSEKVKIEDIHFGYMFCMRGRSVHSIPLLEGSDTPSDLRSLWQQQYGWSLGAFQIAKYWKLLKETGFEPNWFNRFQNFFCVWNYVRWILQSPFVWIMTIFLISGPSRLLSATFFAVYFLSFLITARNMKVLGYFNGNPVQYAFLGFFNSYFRSLPVIHCFFDQVRGLERSKYKTRHRKL